MTAQHLKSLLAKIETWPPDRQAQIARIADDLEAQARASVSLTEAQMAEVEMRLAEPAPRFMTLAEARARLAAGG